MTDPSARRDLLRGRFTATAVPRPPGALSGLAFGEACTGCGDCARACGAAIILRDGEGLPVVDMREGGCTFCGDCTRACPTGALMPGAPWPWRAEAGPACLDANGIQCRACEDFCDAAAIRFRPMIGGRARPVIDPETCTGCGACVAPCPAGAISLSPLTSEIRPC